MHRVLIVDDDLKQLVAVGSAFYQRGGFQVYMALGARDGLDRLQQVEPEVLILAGRDLPDEAEAPLWKGLAGARGLGFDPLVVVAAEKKRVEDLRAAAGETISEFIDYPPKLSYIAAGVERLLGASSGGKRHRDASSRFNEEVSRLLRTTLESPA
jgi:DNA-binding NtrC family response regulator